MRIRERFNPRAPCGARQADEISTDLYRWISTHAPLAGRDRGRRDRRGLLHISTHAPLAGRDRSYTIKDVQEFVFQPTRPLRGATIDAMGARANQQDFNPRAPCGARRGRGTR